MATHFTPRTNGTITDREFETARADLDRRTEGTVV